MNQKLVIKLFLLCALMWSSNSSYANEVTFKVGKDGQPFQEREAKREKEKQAKEQKRQTEKFDRLKAEYGFTDEEAANYLRLKEDNNRRLKAVTDSKILSKEEKYIRRQNIITQYRSLVEDMLTPSQYEILQAKQSQNTYKRLGIKEVNRLKRECKKELGEVYELPGGQREQKRTEIKNRYEAELTTYLYLENAKKEVQFV